MRRKQAALIFSATPSIIWLRGLTLFFALASPIPKFRRVTRIVLLNKRRLVENAMGQFGPAESLESCKVAYYKWVRDCSIRHNV